MAPSSDVTLHARWILPIDRSPIVDGWVHAAAGRIVDAGHGVAPSTSSLRELGSVAVLPGMVNAHTHLELSALAGQVPPAPSMPEWIRTMLAARIRMASQPDVVSEAIVRAIVEMQNAGTVLVGDISNSLATLPVLSRLGVGGVVFHELLGFNAVDPETMVSEAWTRATGVLANGARVGATQALDPQVDAAGNDSRLQVSVVAHAPYSVSPRLFAAIAASKREAPLSVHLAESAEEIEFLRSGTGAFRALLEDVGAWTDQWFPPQVHPVEYLDELGYLLPGTLVVHGVHLTDTALERLRASGAILVTCPRSNVWVGAGLPPVARFYGAGVPVAIGTDSLASCPSLSLFDELAELRRIAPEVSAGWRLESATRIGAGALGCGADFGTIAPGKRAALVAVDVPPDVTDVEEYLVSGVPSAAIHPLTL